MYNPPGRRRMTALSMVLKREEALKRRLFDAGIPYNTLAYLTIPYRKSVATWVARR